MPRRESLHPRVLPAVKSSRRQLRAPSHSPSAAGSSHLGITGRSHTSGESDRSRRQSCHPAQAGRAAYQVLPLHLPGHGRYARLRPAGQGQHATLVQHAARLPQQGTFFFGQSDKLLGLRGCRGAIAAEDIWHHCAGRSVARAAGRIPIFSALIEESGSHITRRWRERIRTFGPPVKKSQFLETVCADFFRHFPSERDPIRLPLPVEMSQQGTPEL